MKLNFLNALAAIAVGGAVFGSAGCQIENNSGDPRLYIGNGNDQFVQYESGDLSIGKDTAIDGLPSWYNSRFNRYGVWKDDEVYSSGSTTGIDVGLRYYGGLTNTMALLLSRSNTPSYGVAYLYSQSEELSVLKTPNWVSDPVRARTSYLASFITTNNDIDYMYIGLGNIDPHPTVPSTNVRFIGVAIRRLTSGQHEMATLVRVGTSSTYGTWQSISASETYGVLEIVNDGTDASIRAFKADTGIAFFTDIADTSTVPTTNLNSILTGAVQVNSTNASQGSRILYLGEYLIQDNS